MINADFNISFNKNITEIEKYINEKVVNFAGNLTNNLAEAVVAGARKRLLERATPKDEQSKAKIIQLANSIHIGKSKDKLSRTVIIPKGDEGLGMFLEYGTGLVGESNPHPEATKLGWSYAINKQSYRFAKASPESMSKLGFIFHKSNTYLDENDINPLYRRSYKHIKGKVYRVYVKEYTDKLGRHRGGYWKTVERKEKDYEYHYWYKQWVHSQGLKPLRYVYDTKRNLNRIIGQYKRLPDGARKLRKQLEQYKQNGK